MFSINIKLALRNLLRFKSYTILNVAGLAIGLALGIFTMIYASYEYGYDPMLKNRDRMYKLLAFVQQNDKTKFTNYSHSIKTPDLLSENVPEVESFNRYCNTTVFFKKENNPIAGNGIYADENFFRFFTFPLVKGDNNSMLRNPGSIVLSASLANKLFGTDNVISKEVSVLIDNTPAVFTVSGVFKDVEHSSLSFEFVLPLQTFLDENPSDDDIKNKMVEVICLLKPKSDIGRINANIQNLLDKHIDGNNQELFLQSLLETHLYDYVDGKKITARLLVVTIMGLIGGLILLIAAFNFINLAIAIVAKRYREAGIRKIMGSSSNFIVWQFLIESVIICWIALFFAFILLETFLPLYNRMDMINMSIPYGNPLSMLLYIGFATLVGILAALYPALVLGRTAPLEILKGVIVRNRKIGFSRQGLIVFQFVITIFMVSGLFVMSKQADYILKKDIGLNRFNVLCFAAPNSILDHRSSFMSELSSIPEISSMTWSDQNPIHTWLGKNDVSWEGKGADQSSDFWIMNTDTSFMNTLKIRMASGRFFSGNQATDSGAYVINEEAVIRMNLKDPVGKVLSVNNRKGIITGVMNNYNSIQLNGPYIPLILSNNAAEANMLFIRFTGNREVVQKKLEMLYRKYESYIPFTPQLLDDAFRWFNIFAENATKVLSAFTLLALFLSCMGLFGLASFTIESRTKEIGIRKSNGATTFSILRMFLRSYGKWILIASCIGLPLSFLLWNTLLGMFFNFHIPIPLVHLLITPVLVLIVAWSTVIWQSWKAARKNPVDALRYE
jgi:putative ABC transport system permease protein